MIRCVTPAEKNEDGKMKKKIVLTVLCITLIVFIVFIFRLRLCPFERRLDCLDNGLSRVELVSVSRSFVFETYVQCRLFERGVEVERQTIRRAYDSFFEIKDKNLKILECKYGRYCLVELKSNTTVKVYMKYWE